MCTRKTLIAVIVLIVGAEITRGQTGDSAFMLTGIIYDESFRPVQSTHVINMDTRAGVVSDSLGIFRIPARVGDTLLFSNIAFRDTLVSARRFSGNPVIQLRRAYYTLLEARIYPWGATYGDFRKAIIEMPNRQSLGESLGLPRADPDYITFNMDEDFLKSPVFLLTSPVSFLYYNLSRKEKSRRAVYWYEKNREKHEVFDTLTGPENISEITGLSGDDLLEFMAYLFQNMGCDFSCSEFQILQEIYNHWEVYQRLHPPPAVIH
jgi:hypothetical protein